MDGSARWRPKRSRISSRSPRASRPESTSCCSIRSTARSNIDVNVPVGTIFSVYREDHARSARRHGGHAAARAPAGGGRLHHLRLQHDDGVHDGAGRARLHARPVHRRVPALAPAHPYSAVGTLPVGERCLRTGLAGADARAHASLSRTRWRAEAAQRSLCRLTRRRFPSQPARRRRVCLSEQRSLTAWQAAPAVRGESARVHCRAGGWSRDRRHASHSRRRPDGPAPAHTALHR